MKNVVFVSNNWRGWFDGYAQSVGLPKVVAGNAKAELAKEVDWIIRMSKDDCEAMLTSRKNKYEMMLQNSRLSFHDRYAAVRLEFWRWVLE